MPISLKARNTVFVKNKNTMKIREEIIQGYIDGYNSFDIDKMVENFDRQITFENSSDGNINVSLSGIDEFITQAKQAVSYFTERTQTVVAINHYHNDTEITIDYRATLAIDLPNGMAKGDTLKLQGKSIFTFSENKIIKLVDIS